MALDSGIVWLALSLHRSVLRLVSIPLLLAGTLSAQALFPAPVTILGDPNFIGTAANPTAYETQAANVVEGREVQNPAGIAVDNSVSPPRVYIADTANNRVLGFQYATQLTAGAFADIVLGQLNRFSTLGASQGVSTALKAPTGLAVDGAGNLYVADTGNNRIVRYHTPFAEAATSGATTYQVPNLVIGQTSFSGTTANAGGLTASSLNLSPGGSFAGRAGLAIDASGNLWVADLGNNRVLEYSASSLQAGQAGPAAILAVGQVNLVSSAAGSSRTGLAGLYQPSGLAFDSAGDLFVADALGRVVVYSPGIGLNAAAMRIIGVDPTNATNTASAIAIGGSQGTVEGVTVVGSNILVADNNNNRVLVYGAVSTWPAASVQFSPSATQVLGQPNTVTTTANGGVIDSTATTMNAPSDISGSPTEVWVADSGNNRILVFPVTSSGITTTASRVIAQLDFPYNAPNLVEGKEFALTDGAAFGGAAILDTSASPPHLYVADTQNNRILGFNNFASVQTGQRADIVIGQPDFFRVGVNYPSGEAAQPNATGLNAPVGLAVDSAGNLYVADTGNSRVVRFPAPFASGVTANESADIVIGQSSFTSVVTDATASTLSAPVSLAFTSAATGYLVVSDVTQNRVLLFQKPFTTGMSATIVLGQTSLTSGTAGTAQGAFTSPAGVAVDPEDRILVADAGNARVQAFASVGTLAPTSSLPSFSLTTGISQPVSIGMASGGDFWVADSGAGHLLHFVSIDNLPIANPPYTSNATQPAISPRSALTDTYGNLLITDGNDRVLYFAPQVNVLNAANYIVGRALSPGTIVSLFPALSSNILSSGTVIGSTLPLANNLSDTQVLVNGTPSALFYVSPTQINLPLSYALPDAGTANLTVVRHSTGQIYGAAQIQLASASPGLFVEGAQQSGPVAAENQDFSVNTASNPAARGTVLQLYATGEGALASTPVDGQAVSGVDASVATPQILLGATGSSIFVPASNIQYSGLAPGNVGLWQINFTVPLNSPTGTVPITIFMNGISSANTVVTTQVITTVSIK